MNLIYIVVVCIAIYTMYSVLGNYRRRLSKRAMRSFLEDRKLTFDEVSEDYSTSKLWPTLSGAAIPGLTHYGYIRVATGQRELYGRVEFMLLKVVGVDLLDSSAQSPDTV